MAEEKKEDIKKSAPEESGEKAVEERIKVEKKPKTAPEEKKEEETKEQKKPEESAEEKKPEKENQVSKERGGRGRGRSSDRRRRPRDYEEEEWIPKTEIGKKVKAGEVTDIDQILKEGISIMEVGIVDTLLPGLNEEVLDVRRVQRTLDSGRRMRFSILVVVGDKNGHMGTGVAKGTEVGPTIRKAIVRAKLNIIKVPRSCASWECGCGEPHTVPFEVSGKRGSVRVILKPAPKGVGLVAGDNMKTILDFAGISDIWTFSRGHSRTVINQALALYEALKELSRFKEGAKASTSRFESR